MGFKKFGFLLVLRLMLIMAALLLAAYLLVVPEFHASTLLAIVLVIILSWEIFHFIARTNLELNRFLDAVKYADFNQQFSLQGAGAGFDDLGETFNAIFAKFRAVNTVKEAENLKLKALIEQVPTPLLSLNLGGKVILRNNAARHFFGSAHITDISHLTQFGEAFASIITNVKISEKRFVTYKVDGVEQGINITATEVAVGGEIEKLISLNNIQSDLDTAQLQAWQDLVRVLTHEIMNSITPVTSLSHTAVDLIDDAAKKIASQDLTLEDVSGIKDAIGTVARRSESLMSFVSNYQKLTRLPDPVKIKISIAELFGHIALLVTHDWQARGISFSMQVVPDNLHILADRQMVDQVLLNLLQNAAEALDGQKRGTVSLCARLNKMGRIIIEITDNGPGIFDDIIDKIFIPFFTTKDKGSGVGLAFTRQIMIAHEGSVFVSQQECGGAKVTLVF